MTVIARVLLGAAAMIWLVPLTAELLTFLAAAVKRPHTRSPNSAVAKLLFLVPAHDEERLIAACVQSLVSMDSTRSRFKIVVIADNCSDQTAERAFQAGAEVIERRDLNNPGKPAAIEWARHSLPVQDYDAIVIVDADTVVNRKFADALGECGPLRDKAVQAYFGVSNPTASWLSRLGGLLTRIRYDGQYVLKARADLACPLTGNGMCLGTNLLARIGWPNRDLTENWELYARCVAGGEIIEYQREAVLYSEEATSLSAGKIQRNRWQSGRWEVALRNLPSILKSPNLSVAQKVDAVNELAYPSPVVHAAFAALLGAAAWLLGAPVLALILSLSAAPIIAWTLWAWASSNEKREIAAALLRLPLYALWRVGVWAATWLGQKNKIWRRSPREG